MPPAAGVYVSSDTGAAVYARYADIAGNFASTSHDDVFGDIDEWDP